LKKSQYGLKNIAFSFADPRQSSCQPEFDWLTNVEARWASVVVFPESCVAWEADQAMRMLLGNYTEEW
jgi:hypothetical protein